jgi:hypothetical protein
LITAEAILNPDLFRFDACFGQEGTLLPPEKINWHGRFILPQLERNHFDHRQPDRASKLLTRVPACFKAASNSRWVMGLLGLEAK